MKDRLESLEQKVNVKYDSPHRSTKSISSSPQPSTGSQTPAYSSFKLEELDLGLDQQLFSSPSPNLSQISAFTPEQLPLADSQWPLLHPYTMFPPWNNGAHSDYSSSSTDGQTEHYDDLPGQFPLPPTTLVVCSHCGSCDTKEYVFRAPTSSNSGLGTPNVGQHFSI